MVEPSQVDALWLSLDFHLPPHRSGNVELVQRVIIHSVLVITSKHINAALECQINFTDKNKPDTQRLHGHSEQEVLFQFG